MAHTLSQLLTWSAERFPANEAVTYGDDSISYSQLEQASNRLSNALKRNGVRPGDRVGIYMNKSIDAISSLFAILKAGATCVPLDPTGPIERLRYIIADCQIECVLSQPGKKRSLTEILAGGTCIRRVVFTSGEKTDLEGAASIGWSEVSSEPPTAPPQSAIDADLAYILYTSGSTGKPKGVMISHRNALSFIDWASQFFSVAASDRVSCHAPLHFDLVIFDILVTLGRGGVVCLVPSEISVLPADLVRFISEQRVSVWQSVPSVLVSIVNQGRLDGYKLENLRLVLFAGEPFAPKPLRELMQKIPHAQFFNIYGATEVNDVTCYHVEEPPASDAPVPFGKACSNVELFILDDAGRLVTEPGMVGELYVRGSNVTLGYWGKPELTAERFIQNPLHSRWHDPVYRTGDLVERDQEGNYRQVGRRDSQIKLRGYRVHIEEVEGALVGCPGVQEVGVIVLEGGAGPVLKAFLVGEADKVLDLVSLRKHCARFLPKYMLPDEMVQCASLPKTSTGKIDRHALLGTERSSGLPSNFPGAPPLPRELSVESQVAANG